MVKIYEKKIGNNYKKIKYFSGLFKIIKTPFQKKIYMFGIKIYRKNIDINYSNKLNEIMNNIHFNMGMQMAVYKLHSKIFSQFKNINNGKTGVIVATGPTLLHYSAPDNCIHISVNNAYKRISTDYWFAIDGQNIKENYSELMNSEFVKFFGQCITPYPLHRYRSEDEKTVYHIPDCVIDNSINGYKFYFDHPNLKINRDIETQPLPDLGSCVFSAMYFAIYTGIKKIYIVGCDCACNGYFDGKEQKSEWKNGSVTTKLLRGWRIFKEYVEIFHPDVELVSINPVGLKGMFKDVYTQSYLNENPEIKEILGNDIEILKNNISEE